MRTYITIFFLTTFFFSSPLAANLQFYNDVAKASFFLIRTVGLNYAQGKQLLGLLALAGGSCAVYQLCFFIFDKTRSMISYLIRAYKLRCQRILYEKIQQSQKQVNTAAENINNNLGKVSSIFEILSARVNQIKGLEGQSNENLKQTGVHVDGSNKTLISIKKETQAMKDQGKQFLDETVEFAKNTKDLNRKKSDRTSMTQQCVNDIGAVKIPQLLITNDMNKTLKKTVRTAKKMSATAEKILETNKKFSKDIKNLGEIKEIDFTETSQNLKSIIEILKAKKQGEKK